eukprot:tig00000455_g1016.t1
MLGPHTASDSAPAALNIALAVIQRSREAIERAGAEARALLYSTCPRPLAERLLAGEARFKHGSLSPPSSALVAGGAAEASAVCLRLVPTGPARRGDPAGSAAIAAPGALEPASFVHVWGTVVRALDRLADRRGADAFSIQGDVLLAVVGAPVSSEAHAREAVELALEAAELVERVASFLSVPLAAKVGVASGWMLCGVIRRPAVKRYPFNVWGAPVLEAMRLSEAAEPGCVAVARNDFRAALRGEAGPAPGMAGIAGLQVTSSTPSAPAGPAAARLARRVVREGALHGGGGGAGPAPAVHHRAAAAAASEAVPAALEAAPQGPAGPEQKPYPPLLFVELGRPESPSPHLDGMLPGQAADAPIELPGSQPLPSLLSEGAAAAARGRGLVQSAGPRWARVRRRDSSASGRSSSQRSSGGGSQSSPALYPRRLSRLAAGIAARFGQRPSLASDPTSRRPSAAAPASPSNPFFPPPMSGTPPRPAHGQLVSRAVSMGGPYPSPAPAPRPAPAPAPAPGKPRSLSSLEGVSALAPIGPAVPVPPREASPPSPPRPGPALEPEPPAPPPPAPEAPGSPVGAGALLPGVPEIDEEGPTSPATPARTPPAPSLAPSPPPASPATAPAAPPPEPATPPAQPPPLAPPPAAARRKPYPRARPTAAAREHPGSQPADGPPPPPPRPRPRRRAAGAASGHGSGPGLPGRCIEGGQRRAQPRPPP